uniref:NADH dehydrogenase subunit 2 n=1 Tax=Symplana brevistrata TaxID=2231408 RepID=UPI001E6BDB8D|nr:NADH dehydrogenase subunit 2 [Symplana brevistrata]UDL72006.1 NADH dehydrogenase subunit 2 [Symplana brevistrata]
MLMNSSKLLFLSILINSTFMVYSSSNFLMTWMSMEINLISFLPLITKSKKMKDQPMKYFIIQSLSSSMMLLSMIMKFKIETPINFEMFMMISLMMKMGMIPFHLWMLSFMEKLSWMNCFIMNTLQKLSPILVTSQIISFKMLILPMTLSLMIAPISMMSINSIKKIIGYSSIYNSPWMISSMYVSKSLFFVFFLIYSSLNFMMMKKFKNQNIMFMNQITEKNLLTKLNLMTNLFSINGIPPMLGFFPKWMILNKINEISVTISISMMISTIISTFIYLKLVSFLLLNQTTKKKFTKTLMFNEMEMLINILGTILLFIFKPN